MTRVLVAVPDLLFGVQIANAVRLAGGEPVAVRGAADALAALDRAADAPRAVIVDLAARIDPHALIRAAAGRHLPVFAFGPHLATDAIREARAAGAEKVVANSALARALPAWLAARITEGHAAPLPDADDEA